jgi:hypothetical protein
VYFQDARHKTEVLRIITGYFGQLEDNKLPNTGLNSSNIPTKYTTFHNLNYYLRTMK